MNTTEIQRFEQLLDQYGPDFHTWPDELTEEFKQAIQQSDAANAIYADSKELNALLSKAMFVPEPRGITTNVLARISSRKQIRYDVLRMLINWVVKPGAVAASLLFGFALGFDSSRDSLVIEEELTQERFTDDSDYFIAYE